MFAKPLLAQTWQAAPQLIPNPAAKCPDTSRVYEFTLSGSSLSVKLPNGDTKTGSVAADGTARIEFVGGGGVGSVAISGNAPARALQITAPNALPGCVYALKPLSEPAAPRPVIQWNTTNQLISGNAQTCSQGTRGSIRSDGQGVWLFGWGMPPEMAIAAVRLAADGSANAETRTAFRSNATARIKVAPGMGPRLVELVTDTPCSYRIVPD